MTGAYFYLDSEPLPDLDPQADHGGEAGELYFFLVCVYSLREMRLPECPDAVEQSVLAQLLCAHVHGDARAAAA